MSEPNSREEFKKWFEANLLDGEDVYDCGKTMLSASDVFETVAEYLTNQLEKAVVEAEDEIFKQILGTYGQIVFEDFMGEKESTIMQVIKVKDVAEMWAFTKNLRARNKAKLQSTTNKERDGE